MPTVRSHEFASGTKLRIGLETIDPVRREIEAGSAPGDKVRNKAPGNCGQRQA